MTTTTTKETGMIEDIHAAVRAILSEETARAVDNQARVGRPDTMTAIKKKPAPEAPVKRGRGRPRGPTLPPNETRSERIPLRVSRDEKEALEEAAAGGDVSTWIRETGLREARKLRALRG